MLKFFYKVMIVSFMSGSLTLNAQTGVPGPQSYILNNPQSSTTTETLKTGVEDKTDIFATLTMSAVGTLASRMYKYKMTTDVMLATAGGALFIGGEIASFVSLDSALKEIETQITRDEKGNINNEQVRHLERLKQSYEEAKKTAGTKKNLQLAAAGAFAAAGVSAYTMASVEMSALTTCQTGVKTALTLLKAEMGKCAAMTVGAAACMAPVKACTGAVTSYHSTMMSNELSRQAIKPSGAAFTAFVSNAAAADVQLKGLNGLCTAQTSPINLSLQPTCAPLNPLEATNASSTASPATMMAQSLSPTLKKYFSSANTKAVFHEISKPNVFEKTLNVFVPQADAALFSAMGIMSSAAVTYVLTTSATLAIELDFFMLTPKNRAYVWGSLSALTALATTSTENQIKKIQSNIDKIDVILNEINGLGNASGTAQVANTPGTTEAANTYKAKAATPGQIKYSDIGLSNTAKGDLTLPCYTGSEAAKCKSFQSAFKESKPYNTINETSQLELGNIFKIADGVNGTSTIGKGTLEGAAGLAGSSNAFRAALAKAQKNAIEKTKINGGKDDSDFLNKKVADALSKSTNAGLKKSNSSANDMFAGMYGGGSAAAVASSAPANKTGVGNVVESQALKSGGAPDIVDLNAGAGEGTDLGLGLEKSNELSATEGANNGLAAGSATTIDDFDLKNDITKDSSSSLFELISSRYQKSGYPRLLKVKEPQVEVLKN